MGQCGGGGWVKGKKLKVLPLGTISHGTLKPEDLVSAFLDALDGLQLTIEDRLVKIAIRSRYNQIVERSDDEGISLGDVDKLSEDIDELHNLLNEYTPDYTYFGAHEGDGSDYGVWPTDEVPFHEPATDEIGKGPNCPPATHSAPMHFLTVTDHGNCTLYRKQRQGRNNRWVEVWSMV